MATYFDYYEIALSLHDLEFKTDPKRISFSVSDSLYSLYNRGTMTVEDLDGALTERLSFVKGAPLDIDYGIDSRKINRGRYVITSSYLDSPPATPGIVSGPITINFKNRWYAQQQIRSRAFFTEISNIISKIVSPVEALSGTDIDPTVGTDTWYQPLVNDAEFISKILTPNAYSNSANGTPFYSFITNDNVFRFKHAHGIFRRSLDAELNYPNYSHQQNSSPETILDIRYIREEIDRDRPLRNRLLFRIDPDTGNLLQTTERITDHLSPGNKFLPFIADMSLVTGYSDLGREETTVDEKYTETAGIADEHREGMVLERFVVLTPFNPGMRSGLRVQINTYVADREDRSEPSKTFSGPYIVENCEHIWNGEESRGYTKLIVGRKYLQTGNTYLIRGRLAQ